jgi:hypothetical protein
VNFDSLPWTVIRARNSAGVMVFRRRVFPESFEKKAFPHRLNIFWSSTASDARGLPEKEESDRIQSFEDRIVEATEPEEQSVLSLVLTGKEQREFVFHTKNTAEFLRRLTNMPQEEEPYPIEIQHVIDPEWEYVDRVLGDIDLPNENGA